MHYNTKFQDPVILGIANISPVYSNAIKTFDCDVLMSGNL